MKKFLLFIFSLAISNQLYAAGLMVTPNRLHFNNNITSQEIKLINKSDVVETYRVSLQHLRMDEKGDYKEIAETENEVPEKFADDLLKFSPRRVTLQPNEVQTIRVVVKKPDDLAVGEYRSHFLFREEPKPKPISDDKSSVKSNKISITLTPLFGISIPVIVTNGDVKAESLIENMAIKIDAKNHKEILSVDLARSGNASLYGNVLVTFKSNQTKKEYNVGALNNIAVFYPYPKRNVLINLNPPKDVKLSDGIITVKYIAKVEDSDLPEVKSAGKSFAGQNILAEKSIKVD